MRAFDEITQRQSPYSNHPYSNATRMICVRYGFREMTLLFFLKNLNSFHPPIQFTIEKETNVELLIQDVLVNRMDNGILRHNVCHKPTRS